MGLGAAYDHGCNWRRLWWENGDKMQSAGLREIPLRMTGCRRRSISNMRSAATSSAQPVVKIVDGSG